MPPFNSLQRKNSHTTVMRKIIIIILAATWICLHNGFAAGNDPPEEIRELSGTYEAGTETIEKYKVNSVKVKVKGAQGEFEHTFSGPWDTIADADSYVNTQIIDNGWTRVSANIYDEKWSLYSKNPFKAGLSSLDTYTAWTNSTDGKAYENIGWIQGAPPSDKEVAGSESQQPITIDKSGFRHTITYKLYEFYMHFKVRKK